MLKLTKEEILNEGIFMPNKQELELRRWRGGAYSGQVDNGSEAKA